MRHFILIASFIFVGIINCNAQQTDLYIIKLKNGLQIKAELIKVVPDSFAIIKQYGLATKINLSEISEITFSETNPVAINRPGRLNVIKRPLPDSGWVCGYQFGISLGSDGFYPTSSFVARFNALKRIGKNAQAGFSIGLDPYSYYETALAVTTLDFREYFNNKPKSMFLYANAGYGFSLTEPNTVKYGGLNFGFGFGRSYRTANQNVFSMMLGYKSQDMKEDYVRWNVPSTIKYISARRMEFKVECLF
ncbi:MAG: hypothetical protein V4613_05645 [Bacteroidota bacterium]